MKFPLLRSAIGLLSLLGALVLLNWTIASYMLSRSYDTILDSLLYARWPVQDRLLAFSIRPPTAPENPASEYRLTLDRAAPDFALQLELPGEDLSPLRLWSDSGDLHLTAGSEKGVHYRAADTNYAEICTALGELGAALPRPGWKDRFLAALFLRPFITGVTFADGSLSWKISLSAGHLWTSREGVPRQADISFAGWQADISFAGWQAHLSSTPPAPPDAAYSEDAHSPGAVSPLASHSSELQAGYFGVASRPDRDVSSSAAAPQDVPAAELTAGLAEVLRVLAWQIGPVQSEPDQIVQSGKGWLVVRDGHRQMLLRGDPYEIGFQHGSLASHNVLRMARRTVYGVGLLYSLKQGEWFPTAARKLVERQRPFIRPEYFEELRGLADGSGVSLDLLQTSNIFPEFFHCSGVAIMGEASAGGELLHARVLDYMTEIGLQDVAVVLAVEKTGVLPFVTVGYLGFIGSVTGMNDQQVAIGEMGGAGQGDWDGIPMSLLIREALETCRTLSEVETFMRESPRTCEYYYLISDGKGPSAIGVVATPTIFETFGPGVWHEKLQQPVKDALLLSGSGRYENLVRLVKKNYGQIDRDGLIDIIRRPVAMESNLHNVVFQPQSLRLSVADAVRRGLACDQPYRTYTWNQLFADSPSQERMAVTALSK